MHSHNPPAAPDPGEFKWGTVPVAVRDWLMVRTDDIMGLAFRQACDAVRIGVILNDVRKRLKHGLFQRWVRASLHFSPQTARRMMQVARAFAAFQNAQFERFDECALHVLAGGGVPPEVRDRAVEQAREGRRVTRRDALRMLAEHRAGEAAPAPAPGAGAPRRCLCMVPDPDGPKGALRQCPSVFASADPGDRKCPRCRRAAAEADAKRRADVRAADAVRLVNRLERLLAGATKVELVPLEADTDYEDRLFVVKRYAEDALPAVSRALPDLAQAVADALGEGDTKVCANCRELGRPDAEKPLAAFNRNRKEAQGVARWCRECMKETKRADRAAAKAARAARDAAGGSAA